MLLMGKNSITQYFQLDLGLVNFLTRSMLPVSFIVVVLRS